LQARTIEEGTVLGEYLPILMFLFVAVVIACALLVIGWLLGPKKPDAEKRDSKATSAPVNAACAKVLSALM
jgi:NADH:ubiquinone oxidoreductase subunit 3 (subunit A)